MISTWKPKGIIVFFLCCMCLFCASLVQAEDYDEDIFADGLVANGDQIYDPLEPINRAFFVFNDKLYFWVLKPASQTYALFLPEDFRMCIGNAFRNIMSPIRVVNNLLQGKVADSGIEISRFFIVMIVKEKVFIRGVLIVAGSVKKLTRRKNLGMAEGEE